MQMQQEQWNIIMNSFKQTQRFSNHASFVVSAEFNFPFETENIISKPFLAVQ